LAKVRQDLEHYGRKWWRFLSAEYKQAEKVTRGLFRESPPRELESQLEAIDAILDAQEQWATIDEHEEVCAELFGRHWLGDQSDWAELKRKAMWVQNLVKDVQSEALPAWVVTYWLPNRT